MATIFYLYLIITSQMFCDHNVILTMKTVQIIFTGFEGRPRGTLVKMYVFNVRFEKKY